MRILDLMKANEPLFIEDAIESKKMKSLVNEINELLAAMQNEIEEFEAFKVSQTEGQYYNNVVMAKSLAEKYQGNKILNLNAVLVNLQKEENTAIAKYNTVKTKLITALNNLAKESHKEAVVCPYDLFEGELTRCPEGHEVVIMGDRNGAILETIIADIETLEVAGNYENIAATELKVNEDNLNRNVERCASIADEMYAQKGGKLKKAVAMIEKMKEVGESVVEFFTFKDNMLEIGVAPKAVQAYENILTKLYVPIKKQLQKEFKIELEDICTKSVDETEYPTASVAQIEALPAIDEIDSEEEVDNTLATVEEVAEEPVEEEVAEEEVKNLKNILGSLKKIGNKDEE